MTLVRAYGVERLLTCMAVGLSRTLARRAASLLVMCSFADVCVHRPSPVPRPPSPPPQRSFEVFERKLMGVEEGRAKACQHADRLQLELDDEAERAAQTQAQLNTTRAQLLDVQVRATVCVHCPIREFDSNSRQDKP